MCYRMAQKWDPRSEPASRNREEHKQRRELLLTCSELLDEQTHPLLTSLVHLQLAQAYRCLGVDEQVVSALHTSAEGGEGSEGAVALRRAAGPALREMMSQPIGISGLLKLLHWLQVTRGGLLRGAGRRAFDLSPFASASIRRRSPLLVSLIPSPNVLLY